MEQPNASWRTLGAPSTDLNDSYFLHPLPTIPLYGPMMLSIPPTASEKSICYAHNLPSCKMLCHRIQ